MTGHDLLANGRIGKTLLKLAIPAILTTLINVIYNMTDTYFIGLLRDTAMLSGVSFTMPVMWLCSAFTGIITNGAPQLISMYAGKGDHEGAGRMRSFAVYATLLMSLVISLLYALILRPMLSFAGADGASLEYGYRYLIVVVLAMPLTNVSVAMQSVLRSDGQSIKASIASIAGIVTNIILDPILILAFRLDMLGAALATAAGGVVSLIIGTVYTRGQFSVKLKDRGAVASQYHYDRDQLRYHVRRIQNGLDRRRRRPDRVHLGRLEGVFVRCFPDRRVRLLAPAVRWIQLRVRRQDQAEEGR